MIGFHNVRFPENVSWRSSGGPEFKTQVFEAFRGGEKRNIEWSQPLMRFNVAYGVKTDTQMLDVINFFNARQGRAYGFRYKNWGNYKIEDAPIATGDGYSTRLPLWKFYGFPQARMYKRLRKIVRGSVKNVNVLGNPMVEGVDFNINYDTGEIALNDAPGYGIPVYGYLEFDEPVRFDVDSIQAAIDQYNSQSLNRLELVGVKAGFTENSVFAPNEDASGDDEFFESVRLVLNFDDTDVLTDTVDQSELAVPVSFNGGPVERRLACGAFLVVQLGAPRQSADVCQHRVDPGARPRDCAVDAFMGQQQCAAHLLGDTQIIERRAQGGRILKSGEMI